jgi:membrane-associated protease RseP (regulator of RpoE activity)
VVAYYGVTLTVGADSDIVSTFPSLPVQYFQNSWLFSKLVEQIPAITTTVSTMSPPIADQAISQLPSSITASIIPLHPFVIIGMTGLLANALNCLPIGRLDGGRIVMAVGGRETANTIAFAASLVQVLSALFSSSSEAFIFWALFVLFIQRGADLPPENDITPINTDNFIVNILRSSSLAFVSVFTLLTLLPAPVETVETVTKLF